jgi:hypothetical protein
MDKLKNIVIAAALIVIIGMIWQSCNERKGRAELLDQISSYELQNKAFSVKRFSDSSTIAEQTQTLLTQKEAAKLGLIELKGQITKLQSQVSQKQKVRYDSLLVEFVPDNFADTTSPYWVSRFRNGDTSRATIDSVIANSIIVPKPFSSHKQWLNIDGKVTKTGITIDSMTIPNKSTVTVGWKPSGFLHLSKTPVVEIVNTNPNITVEGMNNVVIKKKKGLLQKPLFWTVVGFVGGVFLVK